MYGIPEWEQLRQWASEIKMHTLSKLPFYLEEFERNAKANGIHVHWAKDAKAHNQIVVDILKKHQVAKVVKSKSMLTEECHLNTFLLQKGIQVVDTDLGERIIQLKGEPPSHIVMPAIHLNRREVGELFHEKIGTEKGLEDPQVLTEAARQHLREQYLNAQAAITGVNFAIAEKGGIVVCTNEGNADMGTHAAPLQIHCMGLEKVIPKMEHLGVFTRLLARSATGQAITVYTSHHFRPKPEGEMHVVIVDNGRSAQLGRADFRKSLACIRCGACMNTCPVYRRSGGHSYGYTVPGPIGAILTPGINMEKYADLPFASTLCGSCTAVCPVKIDIHQQLFRWRQVIAEKGFLPKHKTRIMRCTAKVLEKAGRFQKVGNWLRRLMRWLPRWMLYAPFNVWGRQREMPESPKESFREWYAKNKSEK